VERYGLTRAILTFPDLPVDPATTTTTTTTTVWSDYDPKPTTTTTTPASTWEDVSETTTTTKPVKETTITKTITVSCNQHSSLYIENEGEHGLAAVALCRMRRPSRRAALRFACSWMNINRFSSTPRRTATQSRRPSLSLSLPTPRRLLPSGKMPMPALSWLLTRPGPV
jgi:hypothetical protein